MKLNRIQFSVQTQFLAFLCIALLLAVGITRFQLSKEIAESNRHVRAEYFALVAREKFDDRWLMTRNNFIADKISILPADFETTEGSDSLDMRLSIDTDYLDALSDYEFRGRMIQCLKPLFELRKSDGLIKWTVNICIQRGDRKLVRNSRPVELNSNSHAENENKKSGEIKIQATASFPP